MWRTEPVKDKRLMETTAVATRMRKNKFVVPPSGGALRSCRLKAERRTNSCPPHQNRNTLSLIIFLVVGFLPLPSTGASEVNAEQLNSPPPAAVVTEEDSEKSPASDAEETNSVAPQSIPPVGEAAKKPAAPKIAPEKFRDVDDAARLLIWLVVSCGLGGLLLLMVIVLGAKRMRRLTRSQMLKSKYDELEFLRLKHRREAEGLAEREPPKTEIR